MQKNVTLFSIKINEMESHFYFESNCLTEVAKQALFEALKWIGQIEDAAKDMESPKNEDSDSEKEKIGE